MKPSVQCQLMMLLLLCMPEHVSSSSLSSMSMHKNLSAMSADDALVVVHACVSSSSLGLMSTHENLSAVSAGVAHAVVQA